MHSLQGRLGSGLVAALLILFAGQWLAVDATIRHVTEEFVISRLQNDAETLLAAFEVTPQGAISLEHEDLTGIYERPFSGHYYRVMVEERVWRSRSLWDQDILVKPLTPGRSTTLKLSGPMGQPLLVYANGYRKQGRVVNIAIAEDLSHLEQEIAAFRWFYAIVSLVALVVLIAAQILTVRRGLSPLDRIRRQLGELEKGQICELDENAPMEIAPLVSEINRLMAMLNQRLQRSRNALGNLTHALKGPLTMLSQLIESEELENYPALRRQLSAQTENIRRRMERELKRARLAGGVAPGRNFTVATEIPPLLEMLRAIYRPKGLKFKVACPEGAAYAVDREDMMEIFGNLLDNACKWARTTVALTIAPGAELRFLVEDDGPGVTPEQLDHLTKRGVRIDESTSGHGLGLAIVADTVEHYHGTLELGQSAALGGFRVDVTIPNFRGAP